MKLMFGQSGPAVSDAAITAFEQKLGTKLPEDYRQFLVGINGGRPVPDCFEVENHPDRLFSIQSFFGIGCESEVDKLDWNLEEFRKRSRHPLLPIARTGTGDWVCIVVEGVHRGAIVFIDDRDSWGKHEIAQVFMVSTDFNDFLEGIFQYADD